MPISQNKIDEIDAVQNMFTRHEQKQRLEQRRRSSATTIQNNWRIKKAAKKAIQVQKKREQASVAGVFQPIDSNLEESAINIK